MPEIQTYLENADIDWKNMMEKAVNILLTGAGGIFNSVVLVFSKVIGTAARFMIGSIFAVYLLSSKETSGERWGSNTSAFFLPRNAAASAANRRVSSAAFSALSAAFSSARRCAKRDKSNYGKNI